MRIQGTNRLCIRCIRFFGAFDNQSDHSRGTIKLTYDNFKKARYLLTKNWNNEWVDVTCHGNYFSNMLVFQLQSWSSVFLHFSLFSKAMDGFCDNVIFYIASHGCKIPWTMFGNSQALALVADQRRSHLSDFVQK